MANVNGVGTWDNSLFIQISLTLVAKKRKLRVATALSRSLKVWPTWTGSVPETTTSFKNSLCTALSRSEVLFPEIQPDHRQLFWGQQPQKRWLLPERSSPSSSSGRRATIYPASNAKKLSIFQALQQQQFPQLQIDRLGRHWTHLA